MEWARTQYKIQISFNLFTGQHKPNYLAHFHFLSIKVTQGA